MTPPTHLSMVVPEGIDDPARPSGGNVYDRRVAAALVDLGWRVDEHRVRGSWPDPGPGDQRELDETLRTLPDGDVVLVDGLVASGAAAALVPHSERLSVVPLVHLPFGPSASEEAVLGAATTVVTTSRWTRDRLLRTYPLDPQRVAVAAPGVATAPLTRTHPSGGRLLSVGAVTRTKGADVLVEALGRLTALDWRAAWVGSCEVDPRCAAQAADRARALAVAGRVAFGGPRTGGALDAAYAEADLLVAPSRTESYGLVLTEALARGIPVVACDVGGVREAIGRTAGGALPGLLVAPEDPAGLAAALRAWLTDPGLRQRLGRAARERRRTLRAWSDTAADLAATLLVPAVGSGVPR